MILSLAWKALTARLAGPVATAAAITFAVLWLVSSAGQAAEAARGAVLRGERDGWKTAAVGWQASFHEAEARRRSEQDQAVAALARAESACAVKVAEARRSAAAIQGIVTEKVEKDAKGCPARRLVPVERLRDALAPAS